MWAKMICLDPRTKLFMVLTVSSLAVFITNLSLLLCVLLLALAAVAFTGGNPLGLLKKLKKFLLIFVVIVFVQSIFTKGGQPVWQVLNFTVVSDLGLVRGLQMILRFFIIISSAAIMTTAKPREIIQGLVQCKIPYELAFMVTIAIRFLPILRDEVNDILTAIQLRGVNLKQIPLMKRLKTYAYLIMPMITSVLLKAQELSVAMEMRAFRAYPRRTSLRTLKMQKQDYLIIALCFFVFLLVVVLALKIK
ncbi:MAG: energy-coupling factor transporter transmembrane protein EcfT [Firmicutes bacterium]|nr:energy-coupling factor transporter transmembrane protein EcfT [Bacillota bacterium]